MATTENILSFQRLEKRDAIIVFDDNFCIGELVRFCSGIKYGFVGKYKDWGFSEEVLKSIVKKLGELNRR